MATFKVRYLIDKPGTDGLRYFWQPTKKLRAQGWKQRKLLENRPDLARADENARRLAAVAEAETINEELDRWRKGDKTAGPDAPKVTAPAPVRASVNALINDYQLNSRKFKKLAAKTQKDYARYMDLLRDWAGDVAAHNIDAEMAEDFVGKILDNHPRTAKYVQSVGSLLWNYGAKKSAFPIMQNPFEKMDLDYVAATGVVWPNDAILAHAKAADEIGLSSVGDAIVINAWIGQREADVLSLPRDAYRGGRLYVNQSKTKERVALPVDLVPELIDRLERALAYGRTCRVLPTSILVSERTNRTYAVDHFRKMVQEVRAQVKKEHPRFQLDDHIQLDGDRAGQRWVETDDLKFMYLRHTAVTNMFVAGAEPGHIIGVTGHSLTTADQILERYLIRSSALADEAFRRRIAYEKARK